MAMKSIQIGFDDVKEKNALNQSLAMRKKQGQRLSATLKKFVAFSWVTMKLVKN